MFGSEGKGINYHFLKLAEKSIYLDHNSFNDPPLVFPETLIDSLNVNAAVSTILNHIVS